MSDLIDIDDDAIERTLTEQDDEIERLTAELDDERAANAHKEAVHVNLQARVEMLRAALKEIAHEDCVNEQQIAREALAAAKENDV